MALEYKAVFKLQKQFVCIATHFLVMSPCIHVTFFDIIVYIVITVV